MIFVFVPARNIDEAIPALLSFLPNFSKDTEKKLFLYLTVNNLENNDHNQILDLYPQYQKEVVWNPYTLKNCNKSFPLFFLKTMQKFRKFLTGNFPDYEADRIILTNSDILKNIFRKFSLSFINDGLTMGSKEVIIFFL
jgi:hypothetical protein